MKKLILASILIFTLILISGCSKNRNNTHNKKIKIKFWINSWIITPPGHSKNKPIATKDYPEWITKKFMKKYPEVSIDYTIVSPRELKQKISAAIAAGNPPDIFKYFDLKFVKAGLLEPIDDYLEPNDKTDFIKQTLEFGEYNGKHYLWPWHYGTNGMGAALLVYKEQFKKAGIDIKKIKEKGWTFSEFLEACKKLTTKNTYAIGLAAKDELNILNFIYNFGGRLFNEDETKVILNSPETIKALNYLLDLVNKYKVCVPGVQALGFYDIVGMFHSHKTAICFGGPYEIGRIYRYYKKGKINSTFNPVVLPYPYLPGYKKTAHTTSGGFIVFKQKNKRKKEYVMKFAKFLTNSNNIKLLETINYITARKSVNKLLFKNSPIFPEVQTYSKIIQKNGISLTGSEKVHYSKIKKYIINLFETVFHKNKTPEQALLEFDNNIKQIHFRVE